MNAELLTIDQMELLSGEGWKNWVDRSCALFGLTTLYTTEAIILNPVGGVFAGA